LPSAPQGDKTSVFTPAEIAYLQSQRLGRLATVGADGQPHVVPVSFRYNPDLGTIDIGGHDFAKRKKFRDVQQNPRVAFVIDDLASVKIPGDHAGSKSGAKPRCWRPAAGRLCRVLTRRCSASSRNGSSVGGLRASAGQLVLAQSNSDEAARRSSPVGHVLKLPAG
jgi:Pyridoxamine 5'-phosphate oxidase